MENRWLFLAPLILLLFAGCKKDEICDNPSLPCQTHEGKNTFGCLIDGSPFVADVNFTIGGPVAVSGSFDETNNYLLLQGKREVNSNGIERINFKSYITNEIGPNIVDVQTSSYIGFTDYDGPKCDYFQDTLNKGQVAITHLDKEKNIISGTFSMTLINPDCSAKQTMVITEGRFDFGYWNSSVITFLFDSN